MNTSTQRFLIVLSISTASGVTPIAIRLAQGAGMPSSVLLLIRLWLISLVLLPIIWQRYRAELKALTRRDWALSAFAGLWLALNLFMFFFALEYTSVLITSVLRRTTPLWIVMPEALLLGAIFSRRVGLSIVLTITGVIIIALNGSAGLELGSRPLIGAGLALFGSVCFGVYLLIGRRLNQRIPSLLYSWIVFTFAGVITTLVVVATGTPVLGYSGEAYFWAFVVFIVAQILGQVVINIGLQRFSATAMAIILQVGVALSVILAVFQFGEIPTLWQLVGSGLIVVGVTLVTMEKSESVSSSS